MAGLKTAHENNFVGCSREELAGFCDALGVDYTAEDETKDLRKKLKASLQEYIEAVAPQMASEGTPPELLEGVKRLEVDELLRMNLRSQAGWKGRRRRITLSRSMDHNDVKHPQFFGFNGLQCYVPFGKQVDVPYPVWAIIQVSNARMVGRQEEVRGNNGKIHYETVWENSPRFMVQDHGDTPGTEHLPRDLHDQWRMVYEMTNGFDGYSVAQLRALGQRLKIRGATDMSKDVLMTRLKAILGISVPHALGSAPQRTAKAG